MGFYGISECILQDRPFQGIKYILALEPALQQYELLSGRAHLRRISYNRCQKSVQQLIQL